MDLKKHGTILLNGIVVVAPIIVTAYIVVRGVLWLESRMHDLLQGVLGVWFPGLGILAGVVAIYVVGLLARTWLLRAPIRLAEALVERIPLVKSLYSSVRDLLQFLGGTEAESRGKPCIVKDQDGQALMLGLVTQEKPEKYLPEGGRVAVYLPMSYQLGGFTVYLPPERVEELPDVSVEELLKLSLTAGVGKTGREKLIGKGIEREEDDGIAQD